MVLAISFWKLKSDSTLETSGYDEMNPTTCFTVALVGPLGNVYKGICGAKHWVPWRPLTKQTSNITSETMQIPKHAGEACGNAGLRAHMLACSQTDFSKELNQK